MLLWRTKWAELRQLHSAVYRTMHSTSASYLKARLSLICADYPLRRACTADVDRYCGEQKKSSDDLNGAGKLFASVPPLFDGSLSPLMGACPR